jgi:hypothetical protein
MTVTRRLHRWWWARFGRRLAPCLCRRRGWHAVDCPRYWPQIRA